MHASSKDNPSRTATPRVGTGYSVGGGHKTTGKAGNQKGQGTPHPVSKCPLSCPEEGRVTMSSDKPATTEPLYAETKVQDGGCQGDH